MTQIYLSAVSFRKHHRILSVNVIDTRERCMSELDCVQSDSPMDR